MDFSAQTGDSGLIEMRICGICFCMQDKVFQWLSISYSSEGFYCTDW